MDANFTLSTLAGIISPASAEIKAVFIQSTLGGLILPATAEITALFIMTTDGSLLWEPIDPTNPAENWTQVTHSGGTWTIITAGSTTNTWTDKVV